MPARVPALQDMTDEHLMRHLELRHPDDLKMEFKALPGREGRRLEAREAWVTYHNTLHRLDAEGKYADHTHREPWEKD